MKVFKNTLLSLVFLLLLGPIKPSFADQNVNSKKITIKVNASLVNAEPYKYENKIVQSRYKPQYGISVNYELLRNLDAGLYVAYSNIGHMLSYDIEVVDGIVVSEMSESVPSHSLYYGLNFNYHLLPLIFKKNNLRFDVYPAAFIGSLSRSWDELNGTRVKVSSFFEYHIGLGLGYKITRRCAIYGEYSLGRLYNEGNSKATVGMAIKF